MSEINEQNQALQDGYRQLSDFDLKSTFHEIRRNHTKESMIDDLTKMTAVMAVMEERGMKIPSSTTRADTVSTDYPQTYKQADTDDSGPSALSIILTILAIIVFIARLARAFS